MGNKQSIVIVVIPIAEVRKFILIDIVISTAAYYALIIPFHSFIAATAGSMTLPMLIRRTLKLRSGR
ncbi:MULTISPECIES: hypothetical protein [Paenibacillus]|uniref:Uncharacterized protein n=1 Tax=Paenibacillus glycanilyticus TaxID=126569 RepID=A0ABQ6NVR8_9BACL|nr:MULTISPECIES: hypothetical protein [Paenibacillus]MCK9858264.1 hypothetical protein [Paenibacillus sp. ATY16]GMK48165.1 hypothetical protein PghCCS26_52950 [Paenibacillus glycanilyticus]